MEKQKRALVLEDTPFFQEMLRKFLAGLDFEVRCGTNGAKGLDLMKKFEFDVIITDWKMPVMDGLEFIKTVRKEEKYKKIPIIMLTSVNESEEIKDVVTSGINAILIKPSSIKNLKDRLKAVRVFK